MEVGKSGGKTVNHRCPDFVCRCGRSKSQWIHRAAGDLLSHRKREIIRSVLGKHIAGIQLRGICISAVQQDVYFRDLGICEYAEQIGDGETFEPGKNAAVQTGRRRLCYGFGRSCCGRSRSCCAGSRPAWTGCAACAEVAGGRTPAAPRAIRRTVETDNKAVICVGCGASAAWRSVRS